MFPFPYHDEDQRCSADYGEDHDEVGFEPIFALTFVEDHLQRSHAQSHEAEADVVDLGLAQLAAPEIGRVLYESRGEQHGNDADGNVDKENPAPGKVVGNPSTKRWSDGGSGDNGDAVDGESHASLGGLKSIGQYSLLAGLQAASASALQHAANDKGGQVRGQAAQERANCEEGNATHVEILAAHDRRKPSAERQDDGVRNKIRSQHPGAFILPRGETPGNVRE